MVRQRMQDDDNGDVEAIVSAVFTENPGLLILDKTVRRGDADDGIFSELIVSDKIERICIAPSVVASSAGEMLRRAIPVLSNLEFVYICTAAITESETETILSILRASPTLYGIGFFLGSCGGEVLKPLRKFLRESSSLKSLILNFEGDYHNRSSVSQGAMSLICQGISESLSLEGIHVFCPPTGDEGSYVAEALGHAVSECTSLDKIWINSDPGNFVELLCSSLVRTEAALNFEVCFHREEGAEQSKLFLNRDAPWKSLLSDNIPLSLWLLILARTNVLTEEDSRRPLDIIHFLTKEKNDVLLQNVRRRRIRKRKRFQFT